MSVRGRGKNRFAADDAERNSNLRCAEAAREAGLATPDRSCRHRRRRCTGGLRRHPARRRGRGAISTPSSPPPGSKRRATTIRELRAFLGRMPKGGDLHTHLVRRRLRRTLHRLGRAAGSLREPRERRCWRSRIASGRTSVPVADAMRDQKIYDRLVNALSMRAFLPTVAVPTGHDEFFATFANSAPPPARISSK